MNILRLKIFSLIAIRQEYISFCQHYCYQSRRSRRRKKLTSLHRDDPEELDNDPQSRKLRALLEGSALGISTGHLPTFSSAATGELSDQGKAAVHQPKSRRPRVPPHNTSVLLFPGQGAQFVGMGRRVLQVPRVRELFEVAEDVLRTDLLRVCLEGPRSSLDRTEMCQPATLVSSLAAVEWLRHENPVMVENCAVAAGFSVGEYAALVFSGALSVEDALQAVKVRSLAMQEACDQGPSGMVTVVTGPRSQLATGCEAARGWCKENGIENPVCQVASYLAPEVKSVAGHQPALDFLKKNARELGLRKVKQVEVSGAFHTQLMASAVAPLSHVLREITLRPPIISVFSNYTGKRYGQNTEDMVRSLARQVKSPVRWEQIMHSVFERPKDEDFPNTYEVGPGGQLGVLLKLCNAKAHNQYRKIEV